MRTSHLFITLFLGLFGLIFVFTIFGLVTGCAHLTNQDKMDLAEYEAEQSACIAENPGDRAAIDSCRAQVKQDFCAKWAERLDAAVCQ